MKSESSSSTADGIPDEVIRTCETVIASYQSGRSVPPTSWYLIGSWAGGDAVELSDIDLLGVTTGAVLFDGWQESQRVRWHGRVELHVDYLGDLNGFLHAHLIPMLTSAILMSGDDVRTQLPELNLAAYRETVWQRFRQGVEQFFPDGIGTTPTPRADGLPAYVVAAPSWTGEAVWTHDLVVFLGSGATAAGATDGLVAASRSEAIMNFANIEGALALAEWARESVAFLRADHSYRVRSEPAFLEQLSAVSARVPEYILFCLDRIDH